MNRRSAAVLLHRHLCGAVPAPVRLPQAGQAHHLPHSVCTASRCLFLASRLIPAQDPAPDRWRAACSGAGAVCRGTACLSVHLRQLHAHQPGQHGRKRDHKLQLSALLRDFQKPAAHHFTAAAADRGGRMPCAAKGSDAEDPSALEASTGLLRAAARTDFGDGRALVRRTQQALLRL